MAVKPTYEELEQRVQALESNRLQYEDLLESLNDVVFRLDREAKVVSISSNIDTLAGYTHQEITGRSYGELLPPEDTPNMAVNLSRILQGEKLVVEHRMLTKSGDPKWVISHASPIEENGRVVGVRGVLFDTTDQKAVRIALQESEEKYRLLFENAPVGFLHFDQHGIITACNDLFVSIMGLPKDVLVGMDMLHLPDKRIGEAASKALSGRLGVLEENYNSINTGKVTPVRALFAPYRTPRGRIMGGMGIIEDISARRQAEQILKVNEERYRFLVEESNDIVWTFDIASMTYSFVSQSVERILGYRQEEVIGASINLLFSQKQVKDIISAFRKDLESPDSADRVLLEIEHIHKQQHPVWMEINAVLHRDRSGEPVSVSGVSRDISDRKRAEAALQQSEERYRSLFENAPIGIFRTNSTGEAILSNSAMARILGFSSPEEAHAYFTNLDTQLYADPEKRHEFIRLLRKKGFVENFEYEAKIRNGQKKWLSMNARVESSNQDDTFYIEGFTTDITERKQAEQELQKSEVRFRELSEMLPETVFETDMDITLTFVNQQAYAMFGYTREDFEKGLNGLHMLVPEDRQRAAEIAIARFQGNYTGVNEYMGLRKDGSTFPVLFHTNPIIINGAPAGLRGIIVDISERKRIEEQLQKTQKIESIGTLAGGIAHDFNNLLFPIVGLSEMLLEDIPPDTPEWQSVKEINKAAMRGSDLVKQILAFSRKSDRKKTPVQIHQVLMDVLKLSRSTIPADIEIKHDLQANCGLVMADPTQLHQVAMNLITNAYHAVAEQGGCISVTLNKITLDLDHLPDRSMEPGPYARLRIADSGPGIEPAVMDKIFEPYFTTKETGKGTGLGLAVVHGIVKDHRGDIKIHSTVGGGTIAEVLFPLVNDIQNNACTKPDPAIPSGTERVLLVDDEASVVRVERTMLERLGYQVTSYTSSKDALEAFVANPHDFDLVVTDMTMPHMTGDMLARELIAIRPEIPIIICTGFSEKINKQIAEMIGIGGFLMKPVLKADMAQLIRKIVDKG